MRNKIIICVLAAVGLCFMACNNEPKLKKKTRDLEVLANQWEFDQSAKMYYCHFNVAEISSDVYNYGEVSVSREYRSTDGNVYQVALPETTYKSATSESTSVVYYTQHIDFRIGVGYVDIQITNSDYVYGQENPETMLFRLQSGTDIIDLTVQQADWQFDEETKQFYYHFEVPEITEDAYNLGQWSISREYNYGTADAYQVALPLSSYMTDTVQVESTVNYSQHLDYAVGVGFVEVFLTISDFYYDDFTPEAMLFRLQLTY